MTDLAGTLAPTVATWLAGWSVAQLAAARVIAAMAERYPASQVAMAQALDGILEMEPPE